MKGVVARGRGCVLMCTRRRRTAEWDRPRPTDAEPPTVPSRRRAIGLATRRRGVRRPLSSASVPPPPCRHRRRRHRVPLGALRRDPTTSGALGRARARTGIAPCARHSRAEPCRRLDADARRSSFVRQQHTTTNVHARRVLSVPSCYPPRRAHRSAAV